MAQQPVVTVVIEYRARPGLAATAVEELERLIATVVAVEVDCLGIRLLQDLDDPTRLLLLEQWSSREAYLGPHLQTAHLQAFIAHAGEFLEGPPAIRFWTPRAERTRGRGIRRPRAASSR